MNNLMLFAPALSNSWAPGILQNDIQYNHLRGGSVTVTRNGTPLTDGVDFTSSKWFSAGDYGYSGIAFTDAATDTIVIEVNMCATIGWWPAIGLIQGPPYHARNCVIEAYWSGAWNTVQTTTNSDAGLIFFKGSPNNGAGISKIRFTLSNFYGSGNTWSPLRIYSIFAVDTISGGAVANTLMSRTGGNVFGTNAAPPAFIAAGGDSNIDLKLIPKGTGKVKFGTVDAVDVSSSQTLTNKTLTTPILANPKFTDSVYANDGSPLLSTNQTASAVNYLQISNRATGVAPSLHAVGSDTNINLNLISKGSGVVTANSVEIATISGTQTLTNKRITPRVGTTTSSATPAINTDTTDQYTITAQAADITSMSSSLTGTPTDGQKLIIRIKDNGTARAITWGTSWRAIGVTLPTTTTVSKTMYVGAVYNSADSKWDVLAVGQEA